MSDATQVPTPSRRRQPARRAKAPRGSVDAQRARTDPSAPPSGGTQADEGGAALSSNLDASDDVASDVELHELHQEAVQGHGTAQALKSRARVLVRLPAMLLLSNCHSYRSARDS